MENQKYLQSIGVTDEEALHRCLAAMEKYEGNHWWEPDVDPRKFAYYQILEPIMLCANFSQFHESIELLLGRPVYTHEFGINADGLRQEAERAWKYQVGVTSEQERDERVRESIQQLRDWAKEHGKQVIDIQLPQDEE